MTTRRWSTYFISFLIAGGLMMIMVAAHAGQRQRTSAHGMGIRAHLVGELGLSDLCLFTEARYTRHPSTADLGSAFQDHPVSLEHFPSGSLMGPPAHLVEKGGVHGVH